LHQKSDLGYLAYGSENGVGIIALQALEVNVDLRNTITDLLPLSRYSVSRLDTSSKSKRSK
jgi:hypothetical protein